MSQPQLLRNLDEWIAATDDPAAAPLRTIASGVISTDIAYGDAVSYLYGSPEARTLLRRWWTESVCPALPADKVDALSAIFEYDLITQPDYRLPGSESTREELPVVELAGDDYFHRPRVSLKYDVPGILAELRAGRVPDLVPSPTTVDLYYKVGAENFIGSTNHEEIVHFMGMTADEIFAAAGASAQSRGKRENMDIAMLLSENGTCS
jgi:radical SAM C-methyltransferase